MKRIFTRRSDARRLALLSIVTGSVVAASAAAQETGGPTPQQLARDRENPFAQTINLPLAAVTGFGIGPHHDVGEQLTIQPQVPLPLDADWNLIVRSLLPVTFSPDPQRAFRPRRCSAFLLSHAGPQHGIDLGCRTGLSVSDHHQQ